MNDGASTAEKDGKSVKSENSQYSDNFEDDEVEKSVEGGAEKPAQLELSSAGTALEEDNGEAGEEGEERLVYGGGGLQVPSSGNNRPNTPDRNRHSRVNQAKGQVDVFSSLLDGTSLGDLDRKSQVLVYGKFLTLFASVGERTVVQDSVWSVGDKIGDMMRLAGTSTSQEPNQLRRRILKLMGSTPAIEEMHPEVKSLIATFCEDVLQGVELDQKLPKKLFREMLGDMAVVLSAVSKEDELKVADELVRKAIERGKNVAEPLSAQVSENLLDIPPRRATPREVVALKEKLYEMENETVRLRGKLKLEKEKQAKAIADMNDTLGLELEEEKERSQVLERECHQLRLEVAKSKKAQDVKDDRLRRITAELLETRKELQSALENTTESSSKTRLQRSTNLMIERYWQERQLSKNLRGLSSSAKVAGKQMLHVHPVQGTHAGNLMQNNQTVAVTRKDFMKQKEENMSKTQQSMSSKSIAESGMQSLSDKGESVAKPPRKTNRIAGVVKQGDYTTGNLLPTFEATHDNIDLENEYDLDVPVGEMLEDWYMPGRESGVTMSLRAQEDPPYIRRARSAFRRPYTAKSPPAISVLCRLREKKKKHATKLTKRPSVVMTGPDGKGAASQEKAALEAYHSALLREKEKENGGAPHLEPSHTLSLPTNDSIDEMTGVRFSDMETTEDGPDVFSQSTISKLEQRARPMSAAPSRRSHGHEHSGATLQRPISAAPR